MNSINGCAYAAGLTSCRGSSPYEATIIENPFKFGNFSAEVIMNSSPRMIRSAGMKYSIAIVSFYVKQYLNIVDSKLFIRMKAELKHAFIKRGGCKRQSCFGACRF